MTTTLKAVCIISIACFALPPVIGGASDLLSTSHTSSRGLDAKDAPTPRERELMERVARLEADVERQTAANAELAAALVTADARIAELSALVREQLTELAEAGERARERQQEAADRLAELERLRAAALTLTAVMEASNERIEAQATQIQSMIADLAEAAQASAELRQALLEETTQHRRAANEVDRLREQLRACEAERDALAAELAELRGDGD